MSNKYVTATIRLKRGRQLIFGDNNAIYLVLHENVYNDLVTNPFDIVIVKDAHGHYARIDKHECATISCGPARDRPER